MGGRIFVFDTLKKEDRSYLITFLPPIALYSKFIEKEASSIFT